MQRKQPVQARARATCAAILDATIQVLLRDGLPALTTGRVAERAGVSIGTLYQYYADKHALIAAVRARHVCLLVDAVARAVAAGERGVAPAPTALRQALAELLAVKRDNLALSQALIRLEGAPETQDSASDVNRALPA